MDYEGMEAAPLLRLAEGGDVYAAVALAGRLWEGIGVRENPAEARDDENSHMIAVGFVCLFIVL